MAPVIMRIEPNDALRVIRSSERAPRYCTESTKLRIVTVIRKGGMIER
jgi:hypothetical protein